MTKEINFLLLLKVLKAAWWKMLIFTAVIAIIVASISIFVIPKKYASTTKFYVINTSTTSEYTTTALLQATEFLANDYIEIIHSDQMIEVILADIAEKGYTTYSPSNIRSMISSNITSKTSTFSITVTSTDKDLAYHICNIIKEKSPDIINDISRPSYTANMYIKTRDEAGNEVYQQISADDLECITPLRAPLLATAPSSPNVARNTILASLLAVLISYAFFFIRELTDTIIRNEDSAKTMVNETIIGDIPNWTAQSQEKDGNKDKQ